MKIEKQGFEFINPDFKPPYLNGKNTDGSEMLKIIEMAGRNCYQSEMSDPHKFVQILMKNNHLSPIEHCNVTVKIWTDRGVSHEIVRHRLASYSQSSQRYCNYASDKFGSELTMILPTHFYDIDQKRVDNMDYYIETTQVDTTLSNHELQYVRWYEMCENIEEAYLDLIEMGQKPQEARTILPNSLKTDIIMTMNLRSWLHFFELRCALTAHPQLRELSLNILGKFHENIPLIFDKLYELYKLSIFDHIYE